jgi:hypothetical protein
MAANRLSTHLGRLLLVACITVTGLLASEQHGTVKAGGLPVPGATVTATQGDKKVVTTTDDSGFYSFPDLADGVWTITVDSLGLVAASREIGVAPGAPSPEWDLKYETLEAIAAPSVKPAAPATAPAAPATSAAATPPAEKAAETATPAAPATAAATPPGKNAKNAKTPATTTANANGRPSLNAALAAQGQGQGGGFTRLNVGQTGDAASALDTTPPQDMSDMAADGNSSFTINGSVSSGLDMPQGPADWMMGGGRGGPGGMDFGGGGMGPGGIPGMDAGPGGDTGGGGRGGRGGGGPGGGGPGGGMGGPGGGFGGGRGGGGMAGIPNIGGGRGGRGGGPGGRGGRNPSAFGNNRRNPRSTYNFAASINGFTNSFLNARSFSETGQVVAKPSAQTLRSTLTAGGPLKIPHVFDTHGKGTFSINYSLTRNRSGNTWTSLVPTDAEKAGNFSGVLVNGTGGTQVPVNIFNGATPFPNNQIPASMISPIATALLKYYPEPNFTGGTAASPLNFATSATGYTNGDNVNARLSYTFNAKNQVNGGLQWQRQSNVTPSEFAAVIPAWQDTRSANGVNANAAYIYHFTTRLIATTRYTYSRSSSLSTPYFANTTNVEGALGILGTDQAPIYWGPPGLSFQGSGILGLSAQNPSYSHPQTSAVGESLLWVRGVHELTFGADFSRREANTLSQNNPRGSFQFTGVQTALNGVAGVPGSGYDFASFLLGSPATMSINVANSLSGAEAAQLTTASGSALANLQAIQNTPSGGDRYLRTNVYDLYVNDQWRLTPRISLSLGVRWDYQAPTTELDGRLATIDLPANFQIPLAAYNAALATPTGLSVVAGQTGPVTGFQYSNSMLNGQKKDISPRIGFAFKPFPKHSTVIRGGWGLYYIPSIYSSLVGQLDAQTPFGTAYNLSNTCGATIQNALSLTAITQLGCVAKNAATTTNAMNPYFRVGYTQNWQMAIQQNLMANTVATVTYIGTKGTGLPDSFYPNSYPSGGSLTCPSGYYCPNGFAYETSNGNSTDEMVQFQLQRRLRSGLGGSVSYALNKAIDDIGGVAQNWQDIAAERGRTSGISNQTLNVSLQYSTGVGARGGALVNGFKGVLFKDWTVMPGFSLATGAPVTVTAGGLITGGTASTNMRASYIGGPVFLNGVLNPAAFAVPAPGTYGNLGPAVFNGPTRFSTSLSANRTFRLADRKNLTFSVQMQNPLNHPVVSGWYTSISSAQFGAPSNYMGMRTISANMRFNF